MMYLHFPPHSLEEGIMEFLVVNGEFPHLGPHLSTNKAKGCVRDHAVVALVS